MKRLHLFLLFLFAWLLAGAAFATPARAQDRSVVVERRDGDITIQTNGDVRVVETWQVRFDGGPFRFAFRSIPFNRVEDITDWGVSENGQAYDESAIGSPNTYEVEDEGGERKITWNFDPTTDQTRTFELSYTLQGALRIYDGGDQFWWKFIEADREYEILQSTVRVNLPATFQPNQLRATTYVNGVEDVESARIVDGRTVQFNGGPFSGGDEWEIRAQFPHGVVTAAAPSWQAESDRTARLKPLFDLGFGVLGLVTLIGGLLGVYLNWYRRGRDVPTGVVAEFYPKPPSDTPPGVVGTLLDENAEMKDILATLVDLARRGYIEIVENEKEEGFFTSSQDFTFILKNGDTSALRTYEKKLLRAIFGRKSERKMSDLKQKFYKHIPDLQEELYKETVVEGFFKEDPKSTRNRYGCGGVAALVAVGVGGFFGTALLPSYMSTAIVVVIALCIVLLAFALTSFAMPKKTDKGATAAAQWRAFRRYLESIDRYTEVDQAKDQFEQYLPYAVAFGLEQSWVRRFEQVNTPAPTWYQPYGYGPYYRGGYGSGSDNRGGGSSGGGGGGMPSLDGTAGRAFGGLNAMSAGLFGMLNSASSTFTSAPQSSGSGGGGGGGGGGSSGFG